MSYKVKRPATIDGDIVYIQLTQSQTAIVDLADYDNISELQTNWCALWIEHRGYYYAVQATKRSLIYLHRLIIKPKCNELVDHISDNKLDNRRSNLRVCNHQENGFNRGKPRIKCTSVFKGVSLTDDNKWNAHIKVNGKTYHFGLFDTEQEAYEVYRSEAPKYHGEFTYKPDCTAKLHRLNLVIPDQE